MHETFTSRSNKTPTADKRLGFAGVVLLNVAAAALVLAQSSVQLLFLSALPIMVAVFRFGAWGAISSTLIFAIVAEICTVAGYGPFAALDISELAKVFILQTYIASQLLIALPIASILLDRDTKADRILQDEKRLRLAAENSEREKAYLLAHDDLTGLASRRSILEHCEQALKTARDDKHPVSIAIFDVDNFKAFNDKFGHLIGDDVLRMIGKVAKKSMFQGFKVGRIGGEEFLMLMPDTNSADAEMIVENLRLSIMNARLSGRQISATVSAGLATNGGTVSLKAMLKKADDALYTAKNAGRNRFSVAA